MRLPPLNALRAFEAAARHGGFIGAAEELHVTRGAVSRHVKLLEDRIGVQLFRRHPTGVSLTDAGRRLLPVLTDSFGRISQTVETLTADASDLRIICPPATSIRWLIPKLDLFRERFPEIRVRLVTDFYSGGHFDSSEFDIGFSLLKWERRSPDLVTQPLLPVMITPACAPALLQGAAAIRETADLGGARLLHETPRHLDWTDWLARNPVDGVDPESGDDFPNLDMAVKAAVMGSGVVMADLVLCREELSAGLLVAPFPHLTSASSFGDICLIGGREKWDEPKVRAFRNWAAEVAEADAAALAASGARTV